MKPIKRSVTVAIFDASDPARVLVVRRPADDEDLPNAWGLPAATLTPGEGWEGAARRAGRDKLGAELAVGRELNRGAAERSGYTLEMRLYEARITGGTPGVRLDQPGITRYSDWRWDTDAVLQPAARQGSLCCRLFLERGR